MSYTLIHNGTLIDERGGEPVHEAAVLIRNNRIYQVGRIVKDVRLAVGRPTTLLGEIIEKCTKSYY